MKTSPGFPHQRLDAYHLAQELAIACVQATKEMPRGFAEVREQARRAALAVVRHIAEGASRLSPADKRARFIVARGEVAELDATLETAAGIGLASAASVAELRQLACRVGAMLTGLVKREERRMGGP